MDANRCDFSLLSKYRGEIYGLAILWIMMDHGVILEGVSFHPAFEWLAVVFKHGNVGVDIFLFLSGISLYFSMKKNQRLDHYMYNRLMKVMVPYLMISGPYFIYKDLIMYHNPKRFFMDITLQSFIWNGSKLIWYVNIILICYVMYPFIYYFLFGKEKNCIAARVMILCLAGFGFAYGLRWANGDVYNNIEILLTRFPVFFVGCGCGPLVYEKKPMPKFVAGLGVFVMLFSFLIFHFQWLKGFWQRFHYMFFGIACCIVFCLLFDCLKCRLFHKILIWFGGLSFEIYLTHIQVRDYLMKEGFFTGHIFTKWLMILVPCVIFSWLIAKAEKYVIRCIDSIFERI